MGDFIDDDSQSAGNDQEVVCDSDCVQYASQEAMQARLPNPNKKATNANYLQ